MSWVRLLHTFLAGVLGGLANSLAVWLFGILGLSLALGFKMAPVLTLVWLLPRMFWGGLWGLLFLLPILPGKPYLKGLLLSLAPSLAMLVFFFPRMGLGIFGIGAGPTAPLFVLFFNAVWGLVAAAYLTRIAPSET